MLPAATRFEAHPLWPTTSSPTSANRRLRLFEAEFSAVFGAEGLRGVQTHCDARNILCCFRGVRDRRVPEILPASGSVSAE